MGDPLSRRFIAVLLLPAVALLTIFLVFPVGQTVVDSLRPFDPLTGIAPDERTLDNYNRILRDAFIRDVLWRTFKISVIVSVICVIISYPVAYYFVFFARRSRSIILFCVLSPLLVSALVRTYGWLIILGRGGVLETSLGYIAIDLSGIRLLQTDFAVILGLTHLFVAFVFLSLVAALNNIDSDLSRAARILGAGPIRTFLHVVLPLSTPGIVSGMVLVFSLSMGAFITPVILGGSRVRVMAYSIWEQFSVLNNYPAGSALAIVLTLVVAAVVYGSARFLNADNGARR